MLNISFSVMQLEVGDSDADILDVTWVNGDHRARLRASMQTRRFEVSLRGLNNSC